MNGLNLFQLSITSTVRCSANEQKLYRQKGHSSGSFEAGLMKPTEQVVQECTVHAKIWFLKELSLE